MNLTPSHALCGLSLAFGSLSMTAHAADLYLAEYQFNNPLLSKIDAGGAVLPSPNPLPPADWLVVGLAFDDIAGKVYWTHGSFNQGAIRRANLDGSNMETVIAGLVNPRGLALDAAGGTVFWSDTQERRIYRANTDGTGLAVIVDGGNQYGRPTLDLVNGKLYFGDLGAGQIRRCNLDGSGNELVVAGLDDPVSVALDLAAGRIYWLDAQTTTNHVARGDLDGSNVQVLLAFGAASSGLVELQLDLAAGQMFWADEIGALERGVWRAALDGTNATRIYTSPTGWNAGALQIDPESCATPNFPYGAPCVGSLGVPPMLDSDPCAFAGAPFQLRLSGVLGGAPATIFVGLAQGNAPIAPGCSYLLSPVIPPLATFPTAGVGPGNGFATLNFIIPPSLAGGSVVTTQVFAADPGATGGVAATNAIQINIR